MNGPDLLMAALDAQLPTTLGELVNVLGSNSAVAMALSGSDDRGSREYKNALRRVQLYRGGEAKAAGAAAPKVTRGSVHITAKNALLRHATAASLKEKTLDASVPGVIIVSDKPVYASVRTLDEFDPDLVDEMLDDWADGDEQGAWAAFEAGLLDAYGMDPNAFGGVAFEDGSVDDVTLNWV